MMLRGETQTLEMNDGTDGFSFMHQIEGRIDVFERHGVGYERRKFDIATHGIFDHAGKLSLIHISEPTRPVCSSRMPSSA